MKYENKILLLIIILLFSSCLSIGREWHFEQKSISRQELNMHIMYMNLLDSYPLSLSKRNIIINSQITDFEYIDGFIQIGNIKIEYKWNDISITLSGNDSNFIVNEFNGRINPTRRLPSNEIKDVNKYSISFSKQLNKDTIENIFNEYNKGNNIAHAYFEYFLTTNNEKIVMIIDEDFILKIKWGGMLH
jgi:hypothetical protein